FNAFLKTLEEPPSFAIFILATTEKHKILPTILSRCQIFDFKRITNNDTVEHLQEIIEKESIKAEKAALQVIAQKSEGCMRDSLSILDKIVSFTNGTLTYQNTLEHLNILDEDYYFRLLESLQNQDMAAAMMLYDEINRKGFEGDLVLNGFAEFIRNVLVCKDPKSAKLLDVVEGLQEKYIQTAANTSLSYLVSALNILNEAEIQFKMARNKRLHVELAIIKLNFLQQAIELSTESGQVIKKKRLDGPIAFRTKTVPSIQVKTVTIQHPPKLLIQEENKTTASPVVSNPTVQTTTGSTVPSTKPAIKTAIPTPSGPKKSLLDALREKVGDQYAIEEVKEAEVLNLEKLTRCWNEYIQKLEQQQKHSSAGTFKIAQLQIDDDIHFSVTVPALTAQKFVEQEKMMLIDYLHTAFNNRAITFTILVEATEREDVPIHLKLNSKQRFERIAEQYPLVKELRDRLKLEIDY
ncbi:MAG: DNA polymerase III subunit gamma/tau, partial [Chitinophagaceae bacterium]|nr:DNA polymerase III subunit gamma/tau [Chitinophagaceae bacterium]